MSKRLRAARQMAANKRHCAPSVMLPFVAQRDLVFTLMPFCAAAELAALHIVCRAWRVALDAMPLAHVRAFTARIAHAPMLLRSTWAVRHLHALTLTNGCAFNHLQRVLDALANAPHLHTLSINMNELAHVSAGDTRAAFAQLRALTDLTCTAGSTMDFLHFYKHVDALPALTRLDTVNMYLCTEAPLDALQRLLHLREARVTYARLTRTQLHALFACASLRVAHAGCVLAHFKHTDYERRGHVARGIQVVADACAHGARLEELVLGRDDSACAVSLPQLARLTHLRVLDAWWSPFSHAADWLPLRTLASLVRVVFNLYQSARDQYRLDDMFAALPASVQYVHTQFMIPSEKPLPVRAQHLRALAHTRVRELRFTHMRVTTETLEDLHALSHLRVLAMCHVEHADIQSLFFARRAHPRLRMHACIGACSFVGTQ